VSPKEEIYSAHKPDAASGRIHSDEHPQKEAVVEVTLICTVHAIAIGSASELEYLLLLARDLSYFDVADPPEARAGDH